MSRNTGVDYDFIFKLVLTGDSSVGKSNLLLRFTRNEFRLDTQSTIGVEFAYKQLNIDGRKIKTQVWDTAGQERFKTVIPQFYRGSEGALCVFDLTKPDSFDHIVSWIEEVQRHTSTEIPMILVGNKSDLVEQRKISKDQAMMLAKQQNMSYMETSAMNSTNVEQAFTTLVTAIYYRKVPKSSTEDHTRTATTAIATIDSSNNNSSKNNDTLPDTSGVTIKVEHSVKSQQAKKSGCC
ncbi:unnamed protein product [Didymodactylos carnosus]|uniref:Uncharacterized protein n=1 Tax=Didymodactylos carnosus TaxID=1234261 RepID=A0A813P4Z0_9BILA|nr:unnamed protein product [Didymodactylos carnosus]CAF3528556.1 unnamed protein product [Didymodactylos carnosus]